MTGTLRLSDDNGEIGPYALEVSTPIAGTPTMHFQWTEVRLGEIVDVTEHH